MDAGNRQLFPARDKFHEWFARSAQPGGKAVVCPDGNTSEMGSLGRAERA
jgi:hypothetical protein